MIEGRSLNVSIGKSSKNTEAQKFYEKHGFKIIGRGIAEQEQLPDIEYEWVE